MTPQILLPGSDDKQLSRVLAAFFDHLVAHALNRFQNFTLIIIILLCFGSFLYHLHLIRPRNFAVAASFEKVCQCSVKFLWLQRFTIERAKAESNRVPQAFKTRFNN